MDLEHLEPAQALETSKRCETREMCRPLPASLGRSLRLEAFRCHRKLGHLALFRLLLLCSSTTPKLAKELLSIWSEVWDAPRAKPGWCRCVSDSRTRCQAALFKT